MTPLRPFIVAVDGPAGAGKSTIGKALAKRLGLQYLDTGAMYRAVTFCAMQRGLNLADTALIGELARSVTLEVGARGVFVDGLDATAAIRTPEVTAAVSQVAANSEGRAEMRERQQMPTR